MTNARPQAARPNTVFRLSPLATWIKVLTRQPGIDHYSISGFEARTLAGSGTLQKWPKVKIDEQWAVPLITHGHVYPLGRGGQFAGFMSRVYWFNVKTGALISDCTHSDNHSLQTLSLSGMGPWDWMVLDTNQEVALPITPVTLDFAQTDTVYASSWSRVNYRMGHMGHGIGQGNAYIQGDSYNLPDWIVDRRITIETAGRIGQVAYRWTTRIQRPNQDSQFQNLCFWVNTGNSAIQQITCSMDLISVDPETREHTWVKKDTKWNRLGA